jgi:hypothetical protein
VTTPVLTAVVCNYNHGRYLRSALDAMLAQSRPPDELIVVDDASTDDSADVLADFTAAHPETVVLRNESNLGFHGAFARGLAAAKGNYVYSGGADDCVLPGFFAPAMDWASRHPEAGLICGRVVAVGPDGRTLAVDDIEAWPEPRYASPQAFLEEYLEAAPPMHSLGAAFVFRTDALREVGGFRAELGAWSDTFASRAVGLRHGACWLARDCVRWTVLPGSMAAAHLGSVERTVGAVRRAADLMRAPEFRSLFPADHVDRWESGYVAFFLARKLRTAARHGGWAERARSVAVLLPSLARHAGTLARHAGPLWRGWRTATRRR